MWYFAAALRFYEPARQEERDLGRTELCVGCACSLSLLALICQVQEAGSMPLTAGNKGFCVRAWNVAGIGSWRVLGRRPVALSRLCTLEGVFPAE